MRPNLLYKTVRLPFTGVRIPFTYLLWMLLALVAGTLELLRGSINNYLIFTGVYQHVLEQVNLYLTYPAEYEDHNHYGPVFSLIIAPFALLPKPVGLLLWCAANAGLLLYALDRLPLTARQKRAAVAIAALEMMTSLHNVQFNPLLTAWLVMAWVWVREEKDHWATLMIALGFFVKLYGIIGLTFFLFSKHRFRFVAWFALWCGVCFAAPMLLSSPHFIMQTYVDWFTRLAQKNTDNSSISTDNFTDLSVLGMMRRIFGLQQLNTLAVVGMAALLYGLPLLHWRRWRLPGFQLHYLALALMTIVLFSSGSESATYVIAVSGFAVWYVYAYRGQSWMIALLLFVLILTSASSTDLFPNVVKKEFVRRYSLKALPVFLAWCMLLWRCWTGRTETPQPVPHG